MNVVVLFSLKKHEFIGDFQLLYVILTDSRTMYPQPSSFEPYTIHIAIVFCICPNLNHVEIALKNTITNLTQYLDWSYN